MNQTPRVSTWVGGGLLAVGIITYVPFVFLFGIVAAPVAYTIVLAALACVGTLISRHFAWSGFFATLICAAWLYGLPVVHYFIGALEEGPK